MRATHLSERNEATVEVGEGKVGGAFAYTRMRIVAHALQRRRVAPHVARRRRMATRRTRRTYGRNSRAVYIWLKACRAGPVVYSRDRVIARHPTVNR